MRVACKVQKHLPIVMTCQSAFKSTDERAVGVLRRDLDRRERNRPAILSMSNVPTRPLGRLIVLIAIASTGKLFIFTRDFQVLV